RSVRRTDLVRDPGAAAGLPYGGSQGHRRRPAEKPGEVGDRRVAARQDLPLTRRMSGAIFSRPTQSARLWRRGSDGRSEMQLNDERLFREQCYIDGEWVDADDGSTIDVTNPADGSVLGTIPKMGANETRRAIEAAERAWPAWRRKTAKERAVILRRWYELMMENQEDLARLMTLEQGKPITESRGEIAYGGSFIEWFAEEGKRIYGDTIPPHQADKRIVVIKEPVGVVCAITPWNFPNAMIT